MFNLYLFCLVVGGAFVALAAFAGLDGVDFDQDFDPDIQFLDKSAKTEEDKYISRKNRRRRRGLGLPFFSLRFWTFGGCFFGLTGVILSLLNPVMSPQLTLWISIAVGVVSGTAMVWALRLLQRQQADSMVRADDLLGLPTIVEIPFDHNSRGKVRLNIKGTTLDLMAMTEDLQEFSKGDQAFVVGVEKNKVWVVSEAAFKQSSD
ncbi:NfeD-like protein [Limnoraphis robusta Tam1]|uniref:NfeD-like protein n=1 Tax=Limnoraphis robusta TaxID=1118279 RepID=UPI002B208E72|nr:NfeD-like protein [Limnoraphis robusta]MEA5539480.1 NfeD-like protein [Limnoraphis robusta Tam1]